MLQIVEQDVFPLIDRSEMPQIKPTEYGELVVFLAVNNIPYKAGVIDPKLVKLHQKVDEGKAMSMAADVLRCPAVISNDYFVIDGDHRTWRHYQLGTPLPYILIDQPFGKAFATAFDFINSRR